MMQDKILILPVKTVRQQNGYECGLASVMTILKTIGVAHRKDSLKRKLGTSRRRGTHPEKIKSFLKVHSIKYREKHGATLEDLESRIKRRKLCLVVYQAWGTKKYYERLESGHYSVVIGCEKDYLWLADPYVRSKKSRYGKGIRKIKKEIFESRWKDMDHLGGVYDHWMISVS